MNSVQENKNELEAAVRYCESAISRANATIESMEFRQQAATKAWHEQTGREEALQREVADLKQANMNLVCDNDDLKESVEDYKNENRELLKKLQVMTDKYDRMKGYADELLDENVDLEESNDKLKSEGAILAERIDEMKEAAFADTNTIKHLKDKLDELSKAYKDSTQEEISMKKTCRELRETCNLQKDQIAMFQRKMSRLNEVDR